MKRAKQTLHLPGALLLALSVTVLGACRAGSEALATAESEEAAPGVVTLPMLRGPMADYGATPWYTKSIALGNSPMQLALDSGGSFFWATSNLCTTPACNAHAKVDTDQPGFFWVDKTRAKRGFGPWGEMYTWTGAVPLVIDGESWPAISLFASVDYTGPKFQYLTWDGGVGLPSESTGITQGSGFLMRMLYFGGSIPSAEFSMLTEPATGTGYTWFGGPGDPTRYDPRSQVRLQPKKAAPIPYLWGTELYSVKLGGTPLPQLANQTFFLDSGSSRFKGDAQYVYPIMEPLSQLRDSQGDLIFTRTYENAVWVGLYYTKGKPSDYPNLPDLTITIGQSCYLMEATSMAVTLSPEQYSYYVDEGDQAGKWALGVHRLDDLGGLLVGSQFMEFFHTRFTYRVVASSELSQGNMYLHRKTQGAQPKAFQCVSMTSGEVVEHPERR